jgi:hypothetical protein
VQIRKPADVPIVLSERDGRLEQDLFTHGFSGAEAELRIEN